MPVDYINGMERGHYLAQTEREGVSLSSCGAAARWFEQKPAKDDAAKPREGA
jgi:hypothetical protein